MGKKYSCKHSKPWNALPDAMWLLVFSHFRSLFHILHTMGCSHEDFVCCHPPFSISDKALWKNVSFYTMSFRPPTIPLYSRSVVSKNIECKNAYIGISCENKHCKLHYLAVSLRNWNMYFGQCIAFC